MKVEVWVVSRFGCFQPFSSTLNFLSCTTHLQRLSFSPLPLCSVSNGIRVWWNLLTEDVPGWLCLCLPDEVMVLRFDGITCGSAHLEIGPALSDANRTNWPSSHYARTCLWRGRTLTSQTWLRWKVSVNMNCLDVQCTVTAKCAELCLFREYFLRYKHHTFIIRQKQDSLELLFLFCIITFLITCKRWGYLTAHR